MKDNSFKADVEPLPDESIAGAPKNRAREAGRQVAQSVGGGNPMGSWTGIRGPLAAPVSGLLLGSGLGLLYHGWDDYVKPILDGRETGRKNPWKSLLIGALGGAGLGGLSSYGLHRAEKAKARRIFEDEQLEKRQSHIKTANLFGYSPIRDLGRLAQVILRDPTMSELDKQRALAALERADTQTINSLAAASVGGALTGAAIAALLGAHPMIGGAFGGIGGNILGRTFF